MNLKNKKIIVGSYLFLFLATIIFMIFQLKYISGLTFLLIIIESFAIIISFSKEKRKVLNTFNCYNNNNKFQEAISYLQTTANKNIYPGTRLMIESLIVISYINLQMYDEAYDIINKVNWNNFTYIYFGYYSILLNLYFDNISEAKRVFNAFKKLRNQHLNNQIQISNELMKVVEKSEFDKNIISVSKIKLVDYIVKKYEK